MPVLTAAHVPDRACTKREGLRCRVRLADGRVFSGPLAPERHRALQLGILHELTDGLVELPVKRLRVELREREIQQVRRGSRFPRFSVTRV